MINLTDAQRREMENLQKWTETYFDMRRVNREARTAERGPRPTEADLVRYAQIGKPQRLSPSELDAVTGRISWPRLLQAAEFAPQRNALEEVFSHRASSGAIEVDEYLRVYRLTGLMLDGLRRAGQGRARLRLSSRPALSGEPDLRGPAGWCVCHGKRIT